jgi:hypothetical protein
MADWAIVIGVDKYWVPEASLRGAVRDALEVRRWLIDAAGVPESNVKLLLAPDINPVPDGVAYEVPTYDNVISAIKTLIATSGARGTRLFFHYSGHGVAARVNYRDEDAILCSDFTSDLPTKSLGLQSILDYLAATELAEQFFFIDACRNAPWSEEYRIGYMPWPRRRDHTKPPVQQFIMQATSPGLQALEEGQVGNEQGAFTTSLLSGLQGAGKAKAWDPRDQEYVVRFDRLFNFVYEDMHSRRLNVSEKGQRLFQLPQTTSVRGGATGINPVLARFAEAAIASERLKVQIDPFDAGTSPFVVIELDGGAHVDQKKDITAIPIEFQLRPRDYRVRSAATGFVPKERRGWWVELWETREVKVELVAGSDEVSPETLTRAHLPDPDLSLLTGRLHRNVIESEIELYSLDEFAPLELYDSAGVLLAHGNGSVRLTAPPGIYRGVLRLPGVPAVTAVISLDEAEALRVAINAPPPSPSMLDLIKSDKYHIEADESVLVSETSGVGPIAGVQFTTIITMAAGAALIDPNELDAHNLRKLRIQMLGVGMPEGVTLLMADETGGGTIQETRIRFWPRDDQVRGSRSLQPIRPNVGEYAQTSSPGSYWLSIEMHDRPPIVSPVTILPKRVNLIVLSRRPDGSMSMFKYFPPTNGGSTAHPRFLRRLELIQRFYSEGAFERARQLLDVDLVEPITSCLEGYTLLRLGNARTLAAIARNMTTYFGELSDSWIIQAEHELAKGNVESAKSAFLSALDRGVPLVNDGVSHLRDAAQQLGIDHPRLRFLDRIWKARVGGTVWTAWLPDRLREGEVLSSDQENLWPG